MGPCSRSGTAAGAKAYWSPQYGRQIAVRLGCIPAYFVNGNRWVGISTSKNGNTGDVASLSEIAALLHTTDIRGVEVYRSFEEIPAVSISGPISRGAILIWTK